MAETLDTGKLAEELRELVQDAEALLRSGLATGGAQLQGHAEEALRDLKGRLAGLEQQLNARAKDVDSYVRENPWQALAVVGGVALLLGLIMARR